MQEVEAAADTDRPFAVLDVELALAAGDLGPDVGNVREVAGKQGEQVGPHLSGQVGKQGGEAGFEGGLVVGTKRQQVETGTVVAVQGEGLLVGFEAADERVTVAWPCPKMCSICRRICWVWAMAAAVS